MKIPSPINDTQAITGQLKSDDSIHFVFGNLIVIWEWIGEGYDGEFYALDENDKPLLRFTVWLDEETMPDYLDRSETKARPLEDASYCTLIPIWTDHRVLYRYSEKIVSAIRDAGGPDSAYRKDVERLTHLTPSDLFNLGWETPVLVSALYYYVEFEQ